MLKNNFFKNLVCFLAVWAGLLVLIFLGIELYEMIKTFVANITPAFEYVTGGWVVFGMMIVSIVYTLVIAIIRRFKSRKSRTCTKKIK